MDEQIKEPETIEYIVDGADPAVEDDGEWDNPPVEELVEEETEYYDEEEDYVEEDIEAQELAAIEAEQEEEAQLDEQASVPAVRTKEDAILIETIVMLVKMVQCLNLMIIILCGN